MQVLHEKAKTGRPRLGSISSRKDPVRQRQVYLFTHHVLLTTREKGRLHLAKVSDPAPRVPGSSCVVVEWSTWSSRSINIQASEVACLDRTMTTQ